MKNLMKLGYVSIEVIIVAAVVIVGGLCGVLAFIKNGKENQGKAVNAMNDAVAEAQADWTE